MSCISCKSGETKNVDKDVGDIVKMGKYEQDNNNQNGAEDIEWIVIAKDDSTTILMSKYCLDSKPYNDAEIDTKTSWEDSTIRAWLNNEFYDTAFSDDEKQNLKSIDYEGTDNNVILINEDIISKAWPDYVIKTMKITREDVGISLEKRATEIMDYEPLIAKYTDYARERAIEGGTYIDYEKVEKDYGENACFWWTSVSGVDEAQVVEIIPSGGAIETPAKSSIGIRPIILISE